MRDPGKGMGRVVGGIALIAAMMLVTALSACQSTPAASPTAAPAAKPAAAPTAAPAAAPTAAPAAAATAAPAAAAAPKTVTVKIGQFANFTGPMAASGEIIAKGGADYFQWVNDQGGIAYKDPKTGQAMVAKLDATTEDVAYDTTRALGVYQRMKAAGAVAILGHGGVIANAMAEAASKDKIPMIIQSSPSAISLKPEPRYLITHWPPGQQMTMTFVKYATSLWKESRAPRLGLAYFDSPSAAVLMDGVPDFAKKLGWEVLPQEALPLPLTDASIQVKRLMAGKPDWIFLAVDAQGIAVMMRDTARLGFQGQSKWVTNSGAFDPSTFQKVADAETNGAMGWMYRASLTETNLPGMKMVDAISQKYQKAPLTNGSYMEQIGLATVLIGGVKGALEKVGFEALNGEAVRNALMSMKDYDVGGILPPVTISEAKPYLESKARLVEWKDKKENILSGWQDGVIN